MRKSSFHIEHGHFRCLENHHFCWSSLLSPNPCLNWLRENLPSNITTDHFWRNPQTFRGWNGETARCGGRRWEQEPGAPAGTLFGGSQGQGAQPGKWQQNQLISPWKIKTTWTTSEMFSDKRRIRIWTGWFCSNFMHNKEWFFGWFLSAWLLPFQSEHQVRSPIADAVRTLEDPVSNASHQMYELYLVVLSVECTYGTYGQYTQYQYEKILHGWYNHNQSYLLWCLSHISMSSCHRISSSIYIKFYAFCNFGTSLESLLFNSTSLWNCGWLPRKWHFCLSKKLGSTLLFGHERTSTLWVSQSVFL